MYNKRWALGDYENKPARGSFEALEQKYKIRWKSTLMVVAPSEAHQQVVKIIFQAWLLWSVHASFCLTFHFLPQKPLIYCTGKNKENTLFFQIVISPDDFYLCVEPTRIV
jgi:hypothetical protein